MSKAGLGSYYKGVKHLGVSLKEFSNIIDDSLEAIMDAVVEGNFRFKISGIGTIGINSELNKFRKKSINTAESLKLRNKIIEKGGTPLKYEKDESGKIIGDNGGEPWIQYYVNDIICSWRINGKRAPVINGKSFKFTATRDNKKRLNKFIESNNLKESFYANS